MDQFPPDKRSAIMSAVKGKDTTPELRVRKALHAMGYRFRLHRSDLPGKPDIVLPRYRTCIFVHGCFWHQHPGCKRATQPETRREFWMEKLNRNISRDKAAVESLVHLGWRICVIWECQTRNIPDLEKVISGEKSLLKIVTST